MTQAAIATIRTLPAKLQERGIRAVRGFSFDADWAENLIGYGDMLFHQTGSSKNVRVQGCFVDDIEVERVIKFVKQNGQAEYDDTIADEIERLGVFRDYLMPFLLLG